MSVKRPHEPNASPCGKRVCRWSGTDGRPSVQLTLNQLMLSAKQSQTMVSRPANPMTTKGFQSEDKCFSCSMKWHSSAIRCNFCERFVCDECSLRCFRCWFAFCRLCAVKSYDSAHEDNLGVCLTCD